MKKEEIRQRVWTLLEERRVARFPFPILDRIPNFEGAREAASRLAKLDLWRAAETLKANPDSPQRWARRQALVDGKTLYMAVPRLRQAECFVELDPKRIARPDRAASIKGAFALGRPVRPEEVQAVDLVLAGSVAVNREGGRVGKGGGYSDLEYALGREYRFLEEETPVVTTVHPLQMIRGEIPMYAHDIPVDFVATPGKVYRLSPRHPKPDRVHWELLPEEKIAQIPVLQALRLRISEGRALP